MLDEQQKKLVVSIAQTIYTNTVRTSNDSEHVKKLMKYHESAAQNSILMAEVFVKVASDYEIGTN